MFCEKSMIKIWSVLFCLMCWSGCLRLGAQVKQTPYELDIYLCIGQSNMAGRATLTPEVMDTLKHVYLFNDKDAFEEAVNPMNRYSTIRKDMSMQRLGPAYAFGKEMYKQTGKEIGLVINARGGSSINSWLKGSVDGYYEQALARVREAMKHGRLRARS